MSRQERIIYIEIRRNFNRNTQNMKYILILWSFLTSYENGRSKKYFERFNIDTENVNFNLTSLKSHLVRPFKITTQDSFIIYLLLLMYSITFYQVKQQTESPTPCWCGAVISLLSVEWIQSEPRHISTCCGVDNNQWSLHTVAMKRVVRVVESRWQGEGRGARVRRSIGRPELRWIL